MTPASPDGRVSVNVFEQIDAICRDFRKQWKKGTAPRIEDLLAKVGENARANLFRNLLHIDLEARRRAQQDVTSDEYIRRFPDYAPIIRQAFFQSTIASMASAAEDDTSRIEPTIDFEGPAANQLGEYELVRELGRGGFGVVYEARHIGQGHSVALKTLPTGTAGSGNSAQDAERLHRFRREFRTLVDLNHPNLVGMQTLEVDGEQWFFTMDLVEGIDFFSYVRPDGELDEPRLRAVLPHLVSAVMALHGQHIVHRDLKPSNVIVRYDGHPVILDFGLVVELQTRSDVTTSQQSLNFAGTPSYAAPEQATGQRTAAGDWYALGVMLFEALRGELPFSGPALEVLEKKRAQDPPRLSDDTQLPQDLAALTDQLLARDPNARPDALAIAKALSLGTLLHAPMREGEQLLLGRERQLSELDEALQFVRRKREPSGVLISGHSGEGKTALAERFLSPLQRGRNVTVLAGRCYDRESVPLKALDSIVSALCNFLVARKSAAAQFVPDDVRMLTHVFPVLRRVEAVAKASREPVAHLDMKQVRQRAFLALRELLRRIAQDTPIVIFIDDLQWGDAESAAVIDDVLQPPDAPAILFLGSFRSDEEDRSPFLQKWRNGKSASLPAARQLQVGPLSEDHCVELVVTRVQRDTEAVRCRAVELFQETRGNPYLLNQLIDCFDPDTDSFRPLPLHEVIERKLQRLPVDALSLLEVIAVSGQALLMQEASEAAGQPSLALSTLTHMRTERLVRMIGSDEQPLVDTYHDRLRETVLDRLADSLRRDIHRKLAETIERHAHAEEDSSLSDATSADIGSHSNRIYDLAYHFDAAGDKPKALQYALAAAEEAKRQFALEGAIEQYEIGRRNLESASDRVRYRASLGQGETLVLAGRFDEATSILNEAIEFAQNDFEITRIQAVQAEIAYKQKSLVESIAAYENVLRNLGTKVPRTGWGFAAAAAWEGLVHVSHRIVPARSRSASQTPDAQTMFTFRMLIRAAYPYYFRSSLRNLWACTRLLNRAESFPNSAELSSFAPAAFGGSFAFNTGLLAYSEPYIRRSLESVRSNDDLLQTGHNLRFLGYGQLGVGRLTEALDNLKEAADLFETKVPDFWQWIMTRYWMACVHFRLGNLKESEIEARRVFEAALGADQHRMAQSALEPWTRATGGNLPFDQLRSSFQLEPEDTTSTIQLLTAEAHWHLFHERPAEAAVVADQAVRLLRQNWVTNAHTTQSLSTLARALREQAASVAADDPQHARRLNARAARIARWGLRLAYFLSIEYPACARELAQALATQGRLRTALKYAQKSCDVAEQHGARHELAQSQQVLAQLKNIHHAKEPSHSV